MEAKMDGIEGNMEYLKKHMEKLKEGLAKLLEERLPSGDKVFHATREENKRNVNHDFRDSNFEMKTNHIQKLEMSKFDGKDLVTWILHMD